MGGGRLAGDAAEHGLTTKVSDMRRRAGGEQATQDLLPTPARPERKSMLIFFQELRPCGRGVDDLLRPSYPYPREGRDPNESFLKGANSPASREGSPPLKNILWRAAGVVEYLFIYHI